MKKLLIVLMVLFLVLAVIVFTSKVDKTSNVDIEVEDCDAEDLAEGDKDCYGIDLKKKKKTTKTTVAPIKTVKAKTPKAPAQKKKVVKVKTVKKQVIKVNLSKPSKKRR